MKQILLAAAILISLASCEKGNDTVLTDAHPQMTYRNLSSRVVNITTPAGIDISGDGASDVWFEIFHTHDNVQNSDLHRFMVSSGEESRLLVNAEGPPILSSGSIIEAQVTNGKEWKAPAIAELARRTLLQNTGTINWEGSWKDADHKFLAVQVTENGTAYNGWIELSFDTAAEKLVLYRSALSKEGGKDIIAGK